MENQRLRRDQDLFFRKEKRRQELKLARQRRREREDTDARVRKATESPRVKPATQYQIRPELYARLKHFLSARPSSLSFLALNIDATEDEIVRALTFLRDRGRVGIANHSFSGETNAVTYHWLNKA